MATYIPNATQLTEPTEDQTVESAALEFRTLKAYTVEAVTVATEAAEAAAADAEQTALDRIATGADRTAVVAAHLDIQTNWQDKLDAAASSADIAVENAALTDAGRIAAAQSAADADADRIAAEAARDAAFVNADVFATVAAGLAATAVGQQFQVVSADGMSVQRYRVDAGPVATLMASYPSAAAVLDPKPWLAADASEATTTGHRQVRSAIIDVRAVNASTLRTYKVVVLCKDDAGLFDRIQINDDLGANFQFSGTVPNKSTGPVRVTITASSGVQFSLLIDYRQITTTGVILNSSSDVCKLSPSIFSISDVELSVATGVTDVSQIRANPLWRSQLALSLVGGGEASAISAVAAVLDVRGVGIDVSKTWRIVTLCNAHATFNDRLMVSDGTNVYIDNTAIAAPTKAAGPVWKKVIVGVGYIEVLIDYRLLANGFLFSVAASDARLLLSGAMHAASSTLAARIEGTTRGLFGKKIVFFGDSLIESYTIPEKVAPLLGATVINVGMGGCRWVPVGSSGAELHRNEMSMVRLAGMVQSGNWTALINAADAQVPINGDDNRPQAAVLAEMDWSTVDYIAIAYGTNDFSGGVPLGTSGSAVETDFYGAINLTIQRLLTAYPNLQIAIITPIWRGPLATWGDSNLNPNGNGVFLSAYQDALIERGQYHGTPVCPLHDLIGINASNKAAFLSDDLHTNTFTGASRWAQRFASWAKSVWE